MSLVAQRSQDDSGYILVARMDNSKNLSSILKAVSFREVSLDTARTTPPLPPMPCCTTPAFYHLDVFFSTSYFHLVL